MKKLTSRDDHNPAKEKPKVVPRELTAREKAEKACGKGSERNTLAMIFAEMGTRDGERNPAQDQFNLCVEKNIHAQRASEGAATEGQHCITRVVSKDTIVTDCN
jgi:hypothetical protein